MPMSIFFVFILNVIFVSYVRSNPLSGVVCVCLGTNVEVKQSPNVKIADLPDRCNIVIIGENLFDQEPSKEDKTAMAALKAAGKTVYMIYECPVDKNWITIISDPKVLDTFIAPMKTYLKENNIEGLILGYLKIHEGVIPDYATKINTLIDLIKKCVPSIKIGLYLDANDYQSFNDEKIFDFTLTNPTLDFYVVDVFNVGPLCVPNMNAQGGRQPTTSTNPSVVTLEQICDATYNSEMDKSKLVVYIYDLVTKPPDIKSYSDYCSRTGNDLWCADNSKLLYDKVIFLKKIFKGLMIQYLDFDDGTNTCGCGNFPVANTYIDAFEGKPMTSCAKLC